MITCPIESRRDRLIHERNHDPYKISNKPAEPAVCSVCSAVFKGGLWQWLEAWSLDSPRVICPACRRIRDNYPAGLVALAGDFLKTHKQEVINLVRNQETDERSQHPLNRIISIKEQNGEVVVATTDIHLPRRIGQAVRRAYKGTLDLHYDKGACLVRVHWTSPANQTSTIAKQRRKL